MKIAFLGFNCLNGTSQNTVKNGIKNARSKGASIVICSFHWGIELDTTPNSPEKSMAHCAIDNGADLVLGHHPHILQGIEKYKGKYIVYSLGNFCFGGNSNPRDKDTMIFQQTFYFQPRSKKLSSKISARVIPCSLSSTSYLNDYQPCVLSGSERTRVLNKINNLSAGMNTSADKNGYLK